MSSMRRRPQPPRPSAAAALRSAAAEAQRTSVASLVALLAVILGLTALHLNERWLVRSRRSLEEGRARVVTPGSVDVVFQENEGKLVLVAGPLSVPDSLEDPAYGISIRAVKLKKVVQMYQWQETEDPPHSNMNEPAAQVGGRGQMPHDHGDHGERTFSYYTDWFDHLIDSESFDSPMGHHNPQQWPVNASVHVNPRVKIGGFLLSTDLKSLFNEFTPFTSDERPLDPGTKMHAGLYFHAEDVWKPDVGDVRVQFSYAGLEGDLVTVVGRQAGREIRPYHVQETGAYLQMMQPGLLGPDEAFGLEHERDGASAVSSRLGAWFLLLLGLGLLGKTLDMAAAAAPNGKAALTFDGKLPLPLTLSLVMAFSAVGLAWLSYKPWIGVSLLFLSVSPFTIAFLKILVSTDRRYHRMV